MTLVRCRLGPLHNVLHGRTLGGSWEPLHAMAGQLKVAPGCCMIAPKGCTTAQAWLWPCTGLSLLSPQPHTRLVHDLHPLNLCRTV